MIDLPLLFCPVLFLYKGHTVGTKQTAGYVTTGCQFKAVSGTDSTPAPTLMRRGSLRPGLGNASSWRHAASTPLEGRQWRGAVTKQFSSEVTSVK